MIARKVANVTFDARCSHVLGLGLDLVSLHLEHRFHFALISCHLAQYLLLLLLKLLLYFLAEPLLPRHLFVGCLVFLGLFDLLRVVKLHSLELLPFLCFLARLVRFENRAHAFIVLLLLSFDDLGDIVLVFSCTALAFGAVPEEWPFRLNLSHLVQGLIEFRLG